MQATFSHEKQYLSDSELQGIDEIVVWDPVNWVDLIIRNSDQPVLKISGDKAMIQRYRCALKGNTLYLQLGGNFRDRVADAFTTSLTRKRIQVELMIQELRRVRATGLVEVDLVAWNGIEPEIHLFGPGALWGGKLPIMRP